MKHLYFIVGFTDGQSGTFPASFASAVNRYQEIMASALYIEGNFPIVVDDNRTHVKAMRCYRGNGDGLAVGYNNWTSDAQGIGRRTSRSRNDQTVRLIGGQVCAID